MYNSDMSLVMGNSAMGGPDDAALLHRQQNNGGYQQFQTPDQSPFGKGAMMAGAGYGELRDATATDPSDVERNYER